MIRHCVMLRLGADVDAAALDRIMRGLGELVARLDGCSGFCAGPNRDFEGKTPDFPYGFTLDARDAAALAAYAVDPDHMALGAQLVALCIGGGDGIAVYDIEAGP
jgi:hypothetical protein